MDKGAEVSEAVRGAAYERRSLVEMFGGESPISLEDGLVEGYVGGVMGMPREVFANVRL